MEVLRRILLALWYGVTLGSALFIALHLVGIIVLPGFIFGAYVAVLVLFAIGMVVGIGRKQQPQ